MKNAIAYNNEEAILLAGMLYQSYQLFEGRKVFLPNGFEIRSIIRALAGVEEPVEEVFGFIAESQDQIIVVFRGTRTFQDNESNTGFHQPVVYTYGSARTGDPEFAARFDQVVKNSFRIVNVHDIIPTLPARAYPPPFTNDGVFYKHVMKKVPLSFQLNSVAVRNHEIVCYFHKLSKRSPRFTDALCMENPEFCPDSGLCVPFIGVCSPEEEEEE